MSFFGNLNNYDKPGPGIQKNRPKQGFIARFFEVLSRKFFEICKLNLIFIVPFAIISAIILGLNLFGIKNIFINFIPLILIFPFWGGLTFVTRNYVREDHAFVFSDFIEATKNNTGKLIINGLLTYVILILVWVNVGFCLNEVQAGNTLFYIPLVIFFMITILILFMQFYISLMIVTFDLSLIKIYRNALIFSIIAFPRNILLTLFLAILSAIIYLMFLSIPTATILFFIAVLFLFAFISFIINFVVYPVIEKNLIIPYYKDRNNKNLKFIYEDGHLYQNYDYKEDDEDKK